MLPVRTYKIMSDLRDLYQEVILDHSKHPRNKGLLANCTHKALGNNPLCGDKITVFLSLKDGVVDKISFDGSGCAISTASASMLTEHLKGKTEKEIEELFNTFHGLLTEDTTLKSGGPDLGKMVVFEGVKEFPARVKCATLSWHTVMAALKNNEEISTEE